MNGQFVGEPGPELVLMTGGERVLSSQQVAALAGDLYVCPRCQRDQCERCTDRHCTCCAGGAED